MHLLNKGGHFSLYMSLGPGIRSTRALVHKHTQMHKSCVYGPDVYAHSHVHACTQNHIRATQTICERQRPLTCTRERLEMIWTRTWSIWVGAPQPLDEMKEYLGERVTL